MNPWLILAGWIVIAVPVAYFGGKLCAANEALEPSPADVAADDALVEHLRGGGPPSDDDIERALAGWRDEAQDGT